MLHPNNIFFLLGMVLLSACSTQPEKPEMQDTKPVRVTTAKPNLRIQGSINTSGQVVATETAHISTRLMGLVNKIYVSVGDHVEKGQLLVSIHNEDIMAKKAQAEATLRQAQAAMLQAERDLQRFTELHKLQSASDKELENITLHFNATKAQAEAALQMKNELNATLAYTNLTAPFAGTITQQLLDAGNIAGPGIAILHMEGLGTLQVNATLSENDIFKIRKGMPADVLVKSTGKSFKGRLKEVSHSSEFTGGQYRITVAIEKENAQGLYAGMYVNVSIPVAEAMGKNPLVPQSSIVYKDQMTGLYTIGANHTAMLRWVRLGKKHGGEVEILSGLSGNETFIAEAEGRLYNGVNVKVGK